MRKRRMVRAGWSAALAGCALAGALAVGAAPSSWAQSSQRPWLGVTTQEITGELREGLDYRGNGVLVNSVASDSPADRAGLEKGDVLVSFNSRTIDTPSELVDVVRAARIGQSVSLVIMRDGERRTLTARLAARPDDEMDYEAPEAPTPPRAPRAPRAPRTPRAFTWNGDGFEMPDMSGMTMLRGFGRGRLGVYIQDINEDLGDALGVTGGKGVLVTDVVEDSPAAKAGIKGGDVITQVGSVTIDDTGDLQRELRKHEGKTSITLVRRGSRRTVEPELDDREVTRWRSGDGDRKTIVIPDVRRKVDRDVRDNDRSRDDMEAEMRQLREELRELRRKVEAGDKP